MSVNIVCGRKDLSGTRLNLWRHRAILSRACTRALPVDQIERSSARIAFARDVQLETVKALKVYWQQRIFSGDESPPPERVTDSDVLTYVRSNSGAIGYVLEGTDLGTGVKALVVTETARDATAVSTHS